mmetsp:Transcript_3663/g.8424  ORF Transcript_3663/g.8424 Transcript_3663/m.8424 type:complete len:231 (-) Transcript_3663:163-855(-)
MLTEATVITTLQLLFLFWLFFEVLVHVFFATTAHTLIGLGTTSNGLAHLRIFFGKGDVATPEEFDVSTELDHLFAVFVLAFFHDGIALEHLAELGHHVFFREEAVRVRHHFGVHALDLLGGVVQEVPLVFGAAAHGLLESSLAFLLSTLAAAESTAATEALLDGHSCATAAFVVIIVITVALVIVVANLRYAKRLDHLNIGAIGACHKHRCDGNDDRKITRKNHIVVCSF